MQSSIAARPTPGTDDQAKAAAWLLLLGAGLVLFRLALALMDRTELSTDEAQYWFWGQHLDFGAYSKPPLIGWMNRAATEILGQSVWAVRLPSVLLHAATAAVIFIFARRNWPQPVPSLAALCYLLAPAVTLGSSLMTTDTPLLLAASVAMLAQREAAVARLAGTHDRRAAVVLGVALGLGLLAKHAMLFWLAGSLAAAALSPGMRPTRSDFLIALAVMLAVVLPHLVWLWQHQFITLSHVEDISSGRKAALLGPLRFLVEQLVVAGPFFVLGMALAIWRGLGGRGLPLLALAPLVIVLVQSLRGPALANWGVLYLVPGSVLAALWLVRHPWLARLSLGLGLVIALALPLAKVFGTDVARPDGRPLLARYLGHGDVALWAIETARHQGAQTVVARDRDLLADLSWFSVGSNMEVRAVPPAGRPRNHWEMTAAFDPEPDGSPLLLLRETATPPCPDAAPVARHVAAPGFAGGEVMVLYRLPDPTCLRPVAPRKDPA